MHFTIANAKGDWLRIEVPAGRFELADRIEVEATPAPLRQLTEEELQAVVRDTDWLEEQDTIIEQRKRLFVRLPKRGQLDGSQMRWEYWDGQQWQPYELLPLPFFSAITEFPDPDTPDFKQPPG